MARPLTDTELRELRETFRHVTNYEDDDPFAPIDPLSYRAPDGDTCLHIASRRGDARAVQLLLEAGLDVNASGDMGSTPLHYAASPEVASLLREAGARTDVRDEFGKTAGERHGWPQV